MVLVERCSAFGLFLKDGTEHGRNIYYKTLKCKHKKASGLLQTTDEKPNGRRHYEATLKP